MQNRPGFLGRPIREKHARHFYRPRFGELTPPPPQPFSHSSSRNEARRRGRKDNAPSQGEAVGTLGACQQSSRSLPACHTRPAIIIVYAFRDRLLIRRRVLARSTAALLQNVHVKKIAGHFGFSRLDLSGATQKLSMLSRDHTQKTVCGHCIQNKSTVKPLKFTEGIPSNAKKVLRYH